MGFFDDFTTAIETYIDDYVDLEVIDVTYPGDRLNVGEQGQFGVRITNRGPLRLNDVALKFTGLAGTLVKGGGAIQQFEPEWVFSGQIDRVDAHGGSVVVGSVGDDYFQLLYFLAPSSPVARTDLVQVTIDDWMADLEHPLVSHSRAGASATLAARVLAA